MCQLKVWGKLKFGDPETEVTGLDRQATASEDSDKSNDNFSANEATSAESENCEDEDESEEVVKRTLLQAGKPPQEQIKFIVFEDAILHPIGECGQCGSKCVVVMRKQIGSCCEICTTGTVDSNHYFDCHEKNATLTAGHFVGACANFNPQPPANYWANSIWRRTKGVFL